MLSILFLRLKEHFYILAGITFNHNFLDLVHSYTKSEVLAVIFIFDKWLNEDKKRHMFKAFYKQGSKPLKYMGSSS